MYMYMYIHIYIYIHTYIHTHIYIHTHTYITTLSTTRFYEQVPGVTRTSRPTRRRLKGACAPK